MRSACLPSWRKEEPSVCRFRKHSGPIVSAWSRISLAFPGLSTARNPMGKAAARLRAGGVCLAILSLSCAACNDKAGDTKAAEDAVRQQLAKYTAALDAADADLAAQVWRTSPDISLIHPAGHAHGWEEIKGFYGYFAANFSERKLTARDVSVHVNGEAAWA